MRVLKPALLSLMILVCVAQVGHAHRFYAAFTQIDLREKKQTVEIVHRLFTHDVEDMLQVTVGNPAGLGEKELEALLRDFVEGAFALYDGEGQRLPLSWIGMEYATDNVLIYQEAPLPADPSQFTVINRLFMKQFEEQKNTVNVEMNGDIRTRIFTKGRERQKVSFTEGE
ncbi:DUF6702 family protein [Paremcibacter congregatus]|uniref:Uncharacterized protein n=1 Tax=Paremcibacter congregatus TaxID=2043170 RepID=A0A2G4YTV0_9PROT|nr:DUF6702 family protein [Paremcibacter congregatus]PHZ85762.1 hypothetical protein CRD36_03515 [Paremcibacter congregatus]QDE26723.1 hypothetical protein FIV45_05280 [Paremcibacter congregatus]